MDDCSFVNRTLIQQPCQVHMHLTMSLNDCIHQFPILKLIIRLFKYYFIKDRYQLDDITLNHELQLYFVQHLNRKHKLNCHL